MDDCSHGCIQRTNNKAKLYGELYRTSLTQLVQKALLSCLYRHISPHSRLWIRSVVHVHDMHSAWQAVEKTCDMPVTHCVALPRQKCRCLISLGNNSFHSYQYDEQAPRRTPTRTRSRNSCINSVRSRIACCILKACPLNVGDLYKQKVFQ